ncbi:MAG TPA: TIGR01777 family oxidoreductase [Candidatus Sumerlaeota bacterium]|nr:TIGR01777 family oxidoreductase [Candidatus Sumerlaeota bacterium]HOR27767.1 TIGR01777 family oxidoreductase [Candidatus Sumerlaeota bacterium]HPK03189.1 TIGR01777 family oxidoreductase [Candidatus Sumerlaeota bacterium]
MAATSPVPQAVGQPQAVGHEPAGRVLVSGSHGLIGAALLERLRADQARVVRLVHGATPRQGEQAISWEPEERRLDGAVLEGFDAVVHLAGESITGRWTVQKKQRIRESRVAGTRLLCERLAAAAARPAVLICASAMGYYGDRGAEILTEENAPGGGFLAEVCQAWEAATEPAREAGIRVALTRFGGVLSPRGGMLKMMLPFFKAGVGGPVGRGDQYVSWIALEDVVRGILWLMRRADLAGPFNFAAPEAVTNREFARTLGRVLKRPAVTPAPAAAVRLALGEMAEELLLASIRMTPARLQASGFEFRHPRLEDALRAML